MMTMGFGKYKGRPLSELPDDYIEWCLENLTELRPAYRQALQGERARRHAIPQRIVELSAFLEGTHAARDLRTQENRFAALMELAVLRGW